MNKMNIALEDLFASHRAHIGSVQGPVTSHAEEVAQDHAQNPNLKEKQRSPSQHPNQCKKLKILAVYLSVIVSIFFCMRSCRTLLINYRPSKSLSVKSKNDKIKGMQKYDF